MKTRVFLVLLVAATGFFASSLARAEDDDCGLATPDKFLPKKGSTAPPSNALPAPPTDNDCAFYNWAWQEFLYATERRPNGRPAFLSYPTIERAFPGVFAKSGNKDSGSGDGLILSVRNIEPILNKSARGSLAYVALNAGDPTPVLNNGVMQASIDAGGTGSILVDHHGHAVYYAIRVNDEFAQFVRDNNLDDMYRMLTKPPNCDDEKCKQGHPSVPTELEFRPGSMEFKSSWMVVDGPTPNYSNYIVAKAKIPRLKNVPDPSGGPTKVVVDDSRPLRRVRVALLGLHVVGAIDGHPELIWATFEHADEAGNPDIAPAAEANPDTDTQTIAGADRSYPLFRAGTTASDANKPLLVQTIGQDEKFAVTTSIFRMFPGSNSKTSAEDDEVKSLNDDIGKRFQLIDPAKKDWRRNYRLVGAVWINQPRSDNMNLNFHDALSFNPNEERLAGEDRLSNMSMESFTQPDSAGPHCFSCHDTAAQDLLPARRINVSHIFTIVAKAFVSSQPK